MRRLHLEPLYKNGKANSAVIALVEFPDSTVEIPGLPKGWYPIEPISCTVKQILVQKDTQKLIEVSATRFQLPIQLAFAITSHCAQGRTLSGIVCDISSGGHNAYVAASWARNRNSLVITKFITSNAQLNRPLASDLVCEMKRLSCLQHNTLVLHGYVSSTLRHIDDPEQDLASLRVVFNDSGGRRPPILGKRQRELGEPSEKSGKRKKMLRPSDHNTDNHMKPMTNPTGDSSTAHPLSTSASSFIPSELPGCIWDAVDYSCAYDASVLPLVYILRDQSDAWTQYFMSTSPMAHLVTSQTNPRSRVNEIDAAGLHKVRDLIRDYLSNCKPNRFPRRGHVFASCEDVWDAVASDSTRFKSLLRCPSCSMTLVESAENTQLPRFVTLDFINVVRTHQKLKPYPNNFVAISFDKWFLGLLFQSIKFRTGFEIFCAKCLTFGPWNLDVNIVQPAPLLILNCQSWVFQNGPRLNVTLSAARSSVHPVTYRLNTIVYFSGSHFSVRIFRRDASVWTHDGREHGGMVQMEVPHVSDADEHSFLNTRGGVPALLLVYGLDM